MKPRTNVNERAYSASATLLNRSLAQVFWQFDRLPALHRAVVREAVHNIDAEGLDRMSLAELHERIQCFTKAETRAAYGPDHPQAR